MKVIKRNGEYQDFDIQKIRLVLERVSDEIGESLNASDINAVSRVILRDVERFGEAVPYGALHEIVAGALRESGFDDHADAYIKGSKK